MAITGECLCGGVKYEISGKLDGSANCHCSMCRRQSGSAYNAAGVVPPGALKWTSGEKMLGAYESSPGGYRYFCTKCGSSLGGGPKDLKSGPFYVALGTIDGDPGVKPGAHIYVGSKAAWHDITDQLPQFKEFPPQN
jgi:hypothetical protein